MSSHQGLIECAISSWYDRFQGCTFRSVLVPVPESFLAWLLQDGVALEEASEALPSRGPVDAFRTPEEYGDWSSEDECSVAAAAAPAELAHIAAALAAGIEELGGAVAPKLTWSCPQDALWITTTNSLRCQNADEVLLLLKSSDRVAHDAEQAASLASAAAPAEAEAGEAPQAAAKAAEDASAAVDSRADHPACPQAAPGVATDTRQPVQHVVALRKWYNLKPGREFRCFVVGNRLVGACQRDVTQRFPGLAAEAASIRHRIQVFHGQYIQGRFPLGTFTYDCYVPSTPGASLKLVDFNPAGGTTAPLLFEWDELLPGGTVSQQAVEDEQTRMLPEQQCEGDASVEDDEAGGGAEEMEGALDLRIISEALPLRPAAAALYGVPFDFVDSGEGGALKTLLQQAREAGAM